MTKSPTDRKNRFIRELRLFVALAFLLFGFLYSLSLYRRLLLDEPLATIPYGYLTLQSLILAKIIMLGRFLRLGERFSDKSLIIPAIYKTIVFSAFIFFFASFEHALRSAFAEKNLETVYVMLAQTNPKAIIGKIPIVLFVAFPFFCLAEIGSVLGKNFLYLLFFHRKQLEKHPENR